MRPATRPGSMRPRKPATILPRLDLEALSASLDRLAGNPHADALDRAQDLIYDTWDSDGRDDHVMAHRALAISPLCADAYTLLAEQPSTSDADAITLCRLGMKAGELTLGAEFEALRGEFWGWLQTRPYMRARAGLADALYRTGACEEALDHWRAMLDLNPDDNQGVRYPLVLALLERGDDAELRDLLDRYADDAGIAMTYTRALVAFRDRDPQAPDLVADAMRSNHHVPAILSGAKRGKPSTNELLMMGGADEATWYVSEAGNAWRATDGAVAWLVELAASVRPDSTW